MLSGKPVSNWCGLAGFGSVPPLQSSATIKAWHEAFDIMKVLVTKLYFHYGCVSMVMKAYAVLANNSMFR